MNTTTRALAGAALGLLLCTTPVQAADIDLACEQLAREMIARLEAGQLLAPGADTGVRARAIAVELCGGAQSSAQAQHETGKQQALDNWFFEDRPEKAGNRRLRTLKR